MATQIVRNRIDSPARWQKALERAIANGIELFIASDDGERFATSASHADQLHRVTAHDCTCEAALAGDPVCQHRAALRFALGWLTLEDRAPETAATIDCAACRGKGWNYAESDGERIPYRIDCRRCGGCGRMPVRIVHHDRAAALAAD